MAAAVALAVTAWLVAGPAAGWARYSSVAVVALLVAAWGFAQRPYLVPTSLTVQQGAGASATMQWMIIVAVVALVFIGPTLVVLYRLDTHGVLQSVPEEDSAE
ncbi:cytochrome d ubiquinol oxidase subunit II [Streptomyces sp. NPDC058398]|uniref:cytochrome d ubiquinol oxidase subunit II n=1 Tax=Streptomyces sp. NPDC058398 TaxID=3346479 RepID=UPI003659D47F